MVEDSLSFDESYTIGMSTKLLRREVQHRIFPSMSSD